MDSAPPREVLLLVFLHGFKGGADTFATFPDRLTHTLSSLEPDVWFQSCVYPPYDTRGELITAVVNHVSWLEELVVEKEREYRKKGGTGAVRVILLGHSMGGLVIADSALSLLNSSPPRPDIIGIIAYDTPYLGLNPAVFKNTIDKALGYAQQGQAVLTGLGAGFGAFKTFTTPSNQSKSAESSRPLTPSSSRAVAPSAPAPPSGAGSSWFSMPVVASLAGAAALAGAAGAAYWQKDNIVSQWSWATSHLSFLGELWSTDLMDKRLEKVRDASEKHGLGFHCFYTLLAKTKENPNSSRTFCVLPRKPNSETWSANLNKRADNEVQAHIEMFTDKSDGMYGLSSETCQLIAQWLAQARTRSGVARDGAAQGPAEQEHLV